MRGLSRCVSRIDSLRSLRRSLRTLSGLRSGLGGGGLSRRRFFGGFGNGFRLGLLGGLVVAQKRELVATRDRADEDGCDRSLDNDTRQFTHIWVKY